MNKELEPFLERAKESYELKELERLGLTPDMEQREKILTYISLIFKWNSVSGLISQKDEKRLFLRHFCDSLQPLLLFGFKKNAKILDIGAGGGFPSIPIQIFRPDLIFFLAESNRKKFVFLNEVKMSLNINTMEICNKRIEKISVPEEKYDYVLSRGLSSLIKFSRIAKPFIISDGRMYTFKTKQFKDELNEITANKEKNGVKISEIAEYDLGNQIFGLKLVSLALV